MSNRMKHEVKALTYHEIGMSLDNSLESAEKEKLGYEGAKVGLLQAKKNVEDLTAHVDKDLKEGVLDIDQATLVKKWLIRAVSVVQNLALQSEVHGHITQGKVVALTAAVKHTKSLYDAEKVRMDASVAQQEGSEEVDPRRPDARAVGEHPGNPIAARRAQESEKPEEPETLLVETPKKRNRKKDAADT